MNDLDLCLEVVSSHVNHCVTFAINVSETVTDGALVQKDHQQEMAYGELNGHVTDDVTHVTKKGQTRDPNTLRVKYRENIQRRCLTTIANYWSAARQTVG